MAHTLSGHPHIADHALAAREASADECMAMIEGASRHLLRIEPASTVALRLAMLADECAQLGGPIASTEPPGLLDEVLGAVAAISGAHWLFGSGVVLGLFLGRAFP